MPTWTYEVDLSTVFHNETMTFEERRDATVRIIRTSRWFKDSDEHGDLASAVEELADTTGIGEFDMVFSAVYDEADADRAWIKTRA